MKLTRRKIRAWLAPIRACLLALKGDSIECIDGFPVLYFRETKQHERIDRCLRGTGELIAQLVPTIDIDPVIKVADSLSAAGTFAPHDLDAALRAIRSAEDELTGTERSLLRQTQIREEIRLELLKSAA